MRKEIKIRPLEEREAEFIKVTEDYYIQVEELDYCVRRKGDKNYHAYFGKFENALAWIKDQFYLDKLPEARDLDQAVKIITSERENFENYIKNALKEIHWSDEKFLTR